MKKLLTIAALALLSLPMTGCVMAVRHLAKEANRSGIQDRGNKRFPIGSSAQAARTTLTAEGYRCLDLAAEAKVKAHVSCWQGHRTNFAEKFLVGGNWRWDLYDQDDKLTKLHISSARHGMKRRQRANSTDVAPQPTAQPATTVSAPSS